MQNILIHVCCAPCFVSIYKELKGDFNVSALWFNGNIHPYLEYNKRLDTVRDFIKIEGIDYIEINNYGLVDFLQKSVFKEEERCFHCYYDRLAQTAMLGKEKNYDYFTTSLLYSKFQKHEMLKEIGISVANKHQIEFYYSDFRELWKEGIALSKERNMYRQQYCGCIYSEYERHCKS